MKKLASYLVVLFIATTFLNSHSSIGQNSLDNPVSEFETLVQYLESNGNFINSETALTIISAAEVKKNIKNPKYHVIDIRSESWFEYAHLKNSTNVKAADLLTYFESKINPADYDKIVLVCYSGQSAAYFSSLLRLADFDNVYSMKWGMSSWRVDFAENSWLKNIKNDFAEKLETDVNTETEKGAYPLLETGKTDAKDILRVRLEKAFATPYKEYILKSPAIFENSGDYFIVNYWDQDKYTSGHIPGAILYEPNVPLTTTGFLSNLPADKKIAVYCSTGQNAAFVVAYLNVLGYNVGNIAFGANSFMNKVLKEKNWDAFTKKEVNMYPVIE
jgi:rhodanese-related sulfurtransferase